MSNVIASTPDAIMNRYCDLSETARISRAHKGSSIFVGFRTSDGRAFAFSDTPIVTRGSRFDDFVARLNREYNPLIVLAVHC